MPMSNHSDSRFWFKRRRYGYGWIPVTWQGWTTVGVFLLLVLGAAFYLEDSLQNADQEMFKVVTFYSLIFLAIIALLAISYLKGPRPKWRWGKREDDNPEEDF